MKEGHIFTDDVIGEDYHKIIRAQIDALDPDVEVIHHHISSPGGNVYGGYKGYHVLKNSGKKIISIIEGEAQSMATFMALAGDRIEIMNPSIFMIHNPSQGLQGDADMLQGGADELRKIEDEMAQAYAKKTKMSVEKIKQMMKSETRMDANEAHRMGFVDEVKNHLSKAVAIGKNMKTEDKTLVQELFTKIEDMFKAFKPAASGPVALDLALADGKMANVMTENGDIVNKPITVDGAPAPDGEHALADGRIIVVAGGVVTEVKEAMSAEQKEIAALKDQLAALTAEKEAAIKAQQDSVKQVELATAAVNEIKREVVALKKLTIGDDEPPSRGKTQDPTAKSKSWETEAREELFKETGLNWLKNIKSN